MDDRTAPFYVTDAYHVTLRVGGCFARSGQPGLKGVVPVDQRVGMFVDFGYELASMYDGPMAERQGAEDVVHCVTPSPLAADGGIRWPPFDVLSSSMGLMIA